MLLLLLLPIVVVILTVIFSSSSSSSQGNDSVLCLEVLELCACAESNVLYSTAVDTLKEQGKQHLFGGASVGIISQAAQVRFVVSIAMCCFSIRPNLSPSLTMRSIWHIRNQDKKDLLSFRQAGKQTKKLKTPMSSDTGLTLSGWLQRHNLGNYVAGIPVLTLN